MPERPQQEELARNEHNQTRPQAWTERSEGEKDPRGKGRSGPVPEENRPGHHPEREQDQPEDPTMGADQAEPTAPGPGDSEG
jgi:hypothetical protein